MRKRSDSVSGQLFEACQRKRTAAQILDYFMASHDNKRKKFPAEPADSPMLWMDFSQVYLAKKFMVSEATIARHLQYLEKRGFLTSFHTSGYDRTKRYQLNRPMVDSIFQKLDLWESVGVPPVDCKMTASIPAKCGDASQQNDGIHPSKMTGCTYPLSSLSYSLSSPSTTIVADAIETREAKEAEPVEVQPTQDPEREALVNGCRELGISREYAEAYLGSHSRQKLQAGISFVKSKVATTGRIRNPGGLLVEFLRNPGGHGHELDAQGCWRPVVVIRNEERQRQAAIKARDRPAEDAVALRYRAARQAWEECDESTKQQIQELIDQRNPTLYAAAKFARCQMEALERKEARCET